MFGFKKITINKMNNEKILVDLSKLNVSKNIAKNAKLEQMTIYQRLFYVGAKEILGSVNSMNIVIKKT